MSSSLLSSHWYRIAKLQPKLHSHVEIHRHDYRGQIWYLLEDTTTGRNHRFNSAAYQFIGLLDGKRNVEDIYKQISEHTDEYSPGEEEIIQLLGQLNTADLIQTDALVNTEELFERQTRQKSSKLQQRLSNPLVQKIPLWDPDKFLNKHFNKIQWLFSGWIAIAWLLVLIYAVLQATFHWQQISAHFNINVLSPNNLILMFLLYPPIKLLHELGHAFCAKLEGGEVHEMGISFLVFVPVPYVNVSTATHFRSKYKRILVSAAGILIESFLAALGILLFLATEPGIIHEIGFNLFIIGGISSLFFNGNPLLKFDGYYILADALDIPNLYQRSGQYWRYLFQRYLFGLQHVNSPANAPGESFWFIVYSLLSLAYRLAILWFISVFVTDKLFFLGVILALWLFSMQILLPIYKAIRFIISNPMLRNKRKSAILTSTMVISLFVAIFGFIPIPSYTLAEGIVWLPDEAQIKAKENGFAGNLQVKNNQIIKAGTPVIRLHDAFLESRVKIARAKLEELKSQFRAERETDLVKATIIKEKVSVAKWELKHILDKTHSMSISAFKSGKIILPEADDLPGRFVRHGELLGYILDDNLPTVRMVVSQDNIGQLRHGIKDIKLRLANKPNREFPAEIIRQAPEATNRIPSATLATTGGGKIVLDPNNQDELLTLEKIFLIDLRFDPHKTDTPLGVRAYVRINHGGEALAKQWFRRIRQVFLRQFNV